jgi:hypothetical protein
MSEEGALTRLRRLKALALSSIIIALSVIPSTPGAQPDACVACHQKATPQAVDFYSKSVHWAKGYSCNRCHAGDATATVKEQAHGAGFTGQPNPNQVVSMCGSCHRSQNAAFKTGKHASDKRGQPRVDCSQCHGAHLVGSSSRNFGYAYYCAGCHGQEYLPALPQDFQRMLGLADMIEATVEIAPQAVVLKKEISRRTGEIVHSTNLDGGHEKIPEILKLGEEFKKMIEKR